jgi:hypothetical protein
MRTTSIIKSAKDKIPGLKVTFSGEQDEIQDLSVTQIMFWNDGSETIRKGDVPSLIRFILTDGKILTANVIQTTTNENKFAIAFNPLQATITFDYIDRNDGAVFQLFHTSKINDEMRIQGTVMGASRPSRFQVTSQGLLERPKVDMSPAYRAFLSIVLVVGLLAFAGLCVIGLFTDPFTPEYPFRLVNGVILGGLAFVILSTISIMALDTFFRKRVPTTLKKFLDDY